MPPPGYTIDRNRTQAFHVAAKYPTTPVFKDAAEQKRKEKLYSSHVGATSTVVVVTANRFDKNVITIRYVLL